MYRQEGAMASCTAHHSRTPPQPPLNPSVPSRHVSPSNRPLTGASHGTQRPLRCLLHYVQHLRCNRCDLTPRLYTLHPTPYIQHVQTPSFTHPVTQHELPPPQAPWSPHPSSAPHSRRRSPRAQTGARRHGSSCYPNYGN